MMLNLQQDPAGGGTPAEPSSPPVVAPPVAPAAPTPSTAPQQPPAAPAQAATPSVAQAPAAEPPIPADTPMLYSGPDGTDRNHTVAELIEAKNTLEQLGDLERIKNLQKVLDGDPTAMQGLLQTEMNKLQPAATPAAGQPAAPLDSETTQRLERLEQEAVHSRRYVDEAQQAQTLQWIQASLATEGISKHIPLTAAHPDAPRRIMENMNTAKVLLSSQGVDPKTPQGQQAMQQALFSAFNSVERQLTADQAHFAGLAQPGARPQVQGAQVPGQSVNGSVVPQPSSGAAPLMASGAPEGPPTKQSMRESLNAQVIQMGSA